MDYSKVSDVRLYLIRNDQNAAEVDAELDRRNKQAARKVNRKCREIPKWKMIDFDRENTRWDLSDWR